jgi:uncharacterized protein YraI
MLKVLFAGTLILSSAILPASAEVGPGVGGGYDAYVCTNDTGGRLTMRKGPGRKHGQIRQIPVGSNIRVVNNTQGKDGFQWFLVSFKGKQGWVRSDFVCTSQEGGQ